MINKNEIYAELTKEVNPEVLKKIIYPMFMSYERKCLNKPNIKKCVDFMILRQDMLDHVSDNFCIPQSHAYLNCLIDYIDMTFADLFFKGNENKKPIYTRLSAEMYFSIFPFVIDRIEFPSAAKLEIYQSLKHHNFKKQSLSKRNDCAIQMLVARDFVKNVFSQVSNKLDRPISTSELKKICESNMSTLVKRKNEFVKSSDKELNSRIINDKIHVYRGFEIESDQNVLINRKERIQDANKSFSFTTEKTVAERFAKYKFSNYDIGDYKTYSERDFLLKAVVKETNIDYIKDKNKKFIVAKYEIDKSDIVYSQVSEFIPENEVFAIPDNAKLCRYTIVYSS